MHTRRRSCRSWVKMRLGGGECTTQAQARFVWLFWCTGAPRGRGAGARWGRERRSTVAGGFVGGGLSAGDVDGGGITSKTRRGGSVQFRRGENAQAAATASFGDPCGRIPVASQVNVRHATCGNPIPKRLQKRLSSQGQYTTRLRASPPLVIRLSVS